MNSTSMCQQLLLLIRKSPSICSVKAVMHRIPNHTLGNYTDGRMPLCPGPVLVFETWLLYLDVIARVMLLASLKDFCFSLKLSDKNCSKEIVGDLLC